METRYLELLAEKYRNIDEVTAEIMNLGTIFLNLQDLYIGFTDAR